jgi:hypothetical protein
VRDRAASSKAASDIRGLTSILSHPQCAYALACDTIDGECCLLPATSAANHCAMPLAKWTSDSGIFEGFSWSVQGREKFHPAVLRFQRGFFRRHKAHRWQGTSERLPKPHIVWRQIPMSIFRHCLGRPRRNAISWRRCRGRIAQRSRNPPRKSSNLAQEKPERRPPLPNMRRRGIW